MANRVMIENIWRKKEKDIIGKKVLEVFPELNNQKYPELMAGYIQQARPTVKWNLMHS